MLSVGGVFHYPRRDLSRHGESVRWRMRSRELYPVNLNALADGARRSDSRNERYSSCNEEQ
jgi:hypothetical protein